MTTHSILEIFQNQTIICVIIAWFTAQVIKLPTYYRAEKVWDFKRLLGAGGMPSSHTSSCVALTIMVGAQAGFDTPVFAVALITTIIIMYDATGVRRETGNQSTVINEILKKVFVDGQPISDAEFRELIGHTPLEVLVGAIIGAVVACIYLIFM